MQVVTGTVTKVEKIGVFIAISNSLLTGLAHISELSDDFVKDPNTKYQVGQAVRAVVLRTDEAKGRVSLGLKGSYFVNDVDLVLTGADESGPSKRGPSSAASLAADDADDDNESVDLEDAMVAAYASSDDESPDSSEEGGEAPDWTRDLHAAGGAVSDEGESLSGSEASEDSNLDGEQVTARLNSNSGSSSSSKESGGEVHDSGARCQNISTS